MKHFLHKSLADYEYSLLKSPTQVRFLIFNTYKFQILVSFILSKICSFITRLPSSIGMFRIHNQCKSHILSYKYDRKLHPSQLFRNWKHHPHPPRLLLFAQVDDFNFHKDDDFNFHKDFIMINAISPYFKPFKPQHEAWIYKEKTRNLSIHSINGPRRAALHRKIRTPKKRGRKTKRGARRLSSSF